MTKLSTYNWLSLSAMTCFEAACRHQNFTHAAKELNMTQAGVSKQIKALESRLGVQLFCRNNRAAELTDAGIQLYEGISRGLRTISETVDAISAQIESKELVISTTVAMASLWFMPRLSSFRGEHPDINIRLVATDSVLDFVKDKVDLSIRYGGGNWRDTESTLLFNVKFYPVCSPIYLKNRVYKGAQDILNDRLLHLTGPASPYSAWDWWFSEHGLQPPKNLPELSFSDYPLLVQAAVAGQGVILAWGNVIDHLVENGDLVRILPGEILAKHSYYIATDARKQLSPNAEAFKNWLLQHTTPIRERTAGT